jgi:predicted AAA+ superfamily ATPase
MRTVTRFFREPAAERSFFLFGPRGTGKSTLVRQLYPDAYVVNLLDADLCQRLEARPGHLGELIQGNPERTPVVIDEVQRAPCVLTEVHRLLDAQSRRRFVLTGSSSRKLKRAGVDLLAGRAVVRNLHPFLTAELGSAFSLARALQFGLVPLVWSADDPADVLSSYVALCLREEVKAEGLVRSIGDFRRFLEVMAFSHAAVLNLSHMARECAVERKTAEGYLAVLRDLLLAFDLPVFTKRARRDVVSHPKFFYFDAGVFRSLRPSGPLDRPAEIDGQALEGLVAQHLRAWCDQPAREAELFFWRTHGGLEVDFVVYGQAGMWAIEVKNTARVQPHDLRGLKAFRREYPESVPLLLYRGRDRLVIDTVLCLPIEEFLGRVHPGAPLPVGP